MEYEAEAPDQEVDQRDRLCKKNCQARKLNRQDGMDPIQTVGSKKHPLSIWLPTPVHCWCWHNITFYWKI